MDVLIVDDHPLIHDSLGAIVATSFPGATVHDERDLDRAIDRARCLERLDLVLLDLGLPGCWGIEALRRFRGAMPSVPVAVVSATEDSASVRAALDAGAVGYIPKTSTPQVIAGALKLIASGGVYVPPEAVGDRAFPRKGAVPSELGLTDRQLEVLRLLAEGRANCEIAAALAITEGTVKQHVHALFQALGVASRTEAMVAAARRGIRPS